MMKHREIKIRNESFARLEAFFTKEKSRLKWPSLFVLPVWLQTWWEVFGDGKAPDILTGYRRGECVGIAPLKVNGRTATFIGKENVCDYQDMIVAPDDRQYFFSAVIDHLLANDIRCLELGTLRPDSVSLTALTGMAEQMGYGVVRDRVATGYEMALPRSWESYLYMLNGKQRHEIRRKLRRLEEAGDITYRVFTSPDEILQHMDLFLSMFRASRPDKSAFMTDQMASFFVTLARRLAKRGWLRLSFLDVDGVPAAGVMCFDYNGTVFLYNSAYDRRFSHLSTGLLSKVYSIKESIERKKRRYDLLKGNEVYKKRLGGKPVALYRLHIDLERIKA